MGSSSTWLIPYVMEIVWEIEPKTILDVGIGTGRYGLLLRDTLEFKKKRIHSAMNWETRIDGIDICKDYICDYHNHIYDKIVIADIRNHDIEDYDLIMFNDIIEHFVKEEGHEVLKKLLKHAKHVIVTTPNGFFGLGNNTKPDNEKHRSGWVAKEFKDYDIEYICSPTPALLMVVLKGER